MAIKAIAAVKKDAIRTIPSPTLQHLDFLLLQKGTYLVCRQQMIVQQVL